MRSRTPLLFSLAAILAWTGCEPQPQTSVESPLEPVFAKGGPTCDTKSAQVRDYFLDKGTQQVVNELLRDLATHCADQAGADIVATGFDILEQVEAARETGAAGDPLAGASVVTTVWNIMRPYVCLGVGGCIASSLDAGYVAAALDLEGAFGVRDAGSEPVVSYGAGQVTDGLPYWFVEPYLAGTADDDEWSEVVPGGVALVLGAPSFATATLDEETIGDNGSAYDWTVLPWYDAQHLVEPLSVTVCDPDLGDDPTGKKEKVSHSSRLLAEGNDGDDFCAELNGTASPDPLLTASIGTRLHEFAASVLPFWPQDLYAGLKGGSGSGQAPEFSPFWGYRLDPVGAVEFITIPGDATAYDPGEPPSGASLICAAGTELTDEDVECPGDTGIRVHLTTSRGSELLGSESVYIQVTAEDNNGSWSLYGTVAGERVSVAGYGLVYQWTDLRLDKPGAYKLHTYYTDAFGCPFADDGTRLLDADGVEVPCGDNTVGIAFPASSSAKFIVNP